MKKLLIFAVLFSALAAYGQVGVEKYEITVTLSPSPQVLVEQQIDVTVGENGFNEPLYRDIPVVQTSSVWVKKDKGFELLSVRKNGAPEAYTVKDTPDSKRIFLETPLKKGAYKYSFSYKSSRIRSYKDADELYLHLDKSLNDFYPRETKVIVKLPDGAKPLYARVFTSENGSLRPADAEAGAAPGALVFNFRSNPSAKEEHIVVVGLEKGFIQHSGGDIESFVSDNSVTLLTLLVFALAAAYYIIVWAALRDREDRPQNAVPVPPEITTAQMRYMYKKIPGQIKDRYKMLTSALLDLAVRGYFKIIADGDVYKLVKAAAAPRGKLNAPDAALLDIIFPQEVKIFLTSSKSVREIRRIIKQNKAEVKREFKGKYIRSNAVWEIIGYALGGAGVLVLWFCAGGGLFYCAAVLALMVLLTLMFRKFFPPFTPAGAKLAEDIMNFRKYLADSEGESKVYNKEFEKYLPYAVALGVENKWARRFEENIENAFAAGAQPYNWLEINFASETLEDHASSRTAALTYAVGEGFVEAFSRTRNISNTEDLKTL
ncbi:MAG: DUF2207 domain-containing protein [Elusimicrobium sp.]|jgi:hypothetical protein|nr:DUF2207 domain-containing protein [Elusimicrobium sp.]